MELWTGVARYAPTCECDSTLHAQERGPGKAPGPRYKLRRMKRQSRMSVRTALRSGSARSALQVRCSVYSLADMLFRPLSICSSGMYSLGTSTLTLLLQ